MSDQNMSVAGRGRAIEAAAARLFGGAVPPAVAGGFAEAEAPAPMPAAESVPEPVPPVAAAPAGTEAVDAAEKPVKPYVSEEGSTPV